MTTYDIHTAAAELDISTEDLMFLLKFKRIQQLCLFRKDNPRFTRFTRQDLNNLETYLTIWACDATYNLNFLKQWVRNGCT